MPATGKANEISAEFRKQNSRENVARKEDQEGKRAHLFAAVQPGQPQLLIFSRVHSQHQSAILRIELLTRG